MSTIAVLSALAAVQLAALTSPGPNILVIGQAASGHSRAIGLFTALGVASAATAWAVAALIGLSLLQTYGAFLYPILRILGGCYLVSAFQLKCFPGTVELTSARTDWRYRTEARRATQDKLRSDACGTPLSGDRG